MIIDIYNIIVYHKLMFTLDRNKITKVKYPFKLKFAGTNEGL
jgi:hypothetical protein